MAQRILIPKGSVNPGETSVIEIPPHFQASNLVVAAPKAMERGIRTSSPSARTGQHRGDHSVSRILLKKKGFSKLISFLI